MLAYQLMAERVQPHSTTRLPLVYLKALWVVLISVWSY